MPMASLGTDELEAVRTLHDKLQHYKPAFSLNMAFYLQVYQTLPVDELLTELSHRGWHVYPRKPGELAVLLPSVDPPSEPPPAWLLADDELTVDVLGRTYLRSAQSSWPHDRCITSLPALCAVMRHLDTGAKHVQQPSRVSQLKEQQGATSEELDNTAGNDDELYQEEVEEDEQHGHARKRGRSNGGKPFPLGRPATLNNRPRVKDNLQSPVPKSDSKTELQNMFGKPRHAMPLEVGPQVTADVLQRLKEAKEQRPFDPPQLPLQAQATAVFTNVGIGVRHAAAPLPRGPLAPAGPRMDTNRPKSITVAGISRTSLPASSPKPAPKDKDRLHRVLRMGWMPLVDVVCNSLCGRFLGGHDKDLYIQCIGSEYSQLPLVDVKEGGCIMTCAQFEKRAGRELSKKWKESIHVVGDTEGARATLITWLRRQAARRFGESVIGKQCWIRWCNDGEFYQATIISYNMDTGKHKVRYSESLYIEELHLPVELIFFTEEKPNIPDQTSSSIAQTLGLVQAEPRQAAGADASLANQEQRSSSLQHQGMAVGKSPVITLLHDSPDSRSGVSPAEEDDAVRLASCGTARSSMQQQQQQQQQQANGLHSLSAAVAASSRLCTHTNSEENIPSADSRSESDSPATKVPRLTVTTSTAAEPAAVAKLPWSMRNCSDLEPRKSVTTAGAAGQQAMEQQQQQVQLHRVAASRQPSTSASPAATPETSGRGLPLQSDSGHLGGYEGAGPGAPAEYVRITPEQAAAMGLRPDGMPGSYSTSAPLQTKYVSLPNGMTAVAVSMRDLVGMGMVDPNAPNGPMHVPPSLIGAPVSAGPEQPAFVQLSNGMLVPAHPVMGHPGMVTAHAGPPGPLHSRPMALANQERGMPMPVDGEHMAGPMHKYEPPPMIVHRRNMEPVAPNGSIIKVNGMGARYIGQPAIMHQHGYEVGPPSSMHDAGSGAGAMSNSAGPSRMYEAVVMQQLASHVPQPMSSLQVPAKPGMLQSSQGAYQAVLQNDIHLTPPPAHQGAEDDLQAMFRWLMAISSELEELLALQQQAIASPLLAQPFSVAARFQTMLVYARASDAIRGFYEMMTFRWKRPYASAAERTRAMADAILAAVYQSTLMPIKLSQHEQQQQQQLQQQRVTQS